MGGKPRWLYGVMLIQDPRDEAIHFNQLSGLNAVASSIMMNISRQISS